jgi:aryl-alcohol dehydrogenase-like predicted oxidoreductase
MQLTGPGVWGEPADRAQAIAVLRRAVELGINLIDTANSYGPYVSEELIHEALHPYPKGLVIATKAGLARTGPGRWIPLGRPEYLRQECEMSLRRWGVERIDCSNCIALIPGSSRRSIWSAARSPEGRQDPARWPFEVNVAEIEAARTSLPSRPCKISTISHPQLRGCLDYCTRENIGFILGFHWRPRPHETSRRINKNRQATGRSACASSARVLLKKTPDAADPGTSKVKHLEENTAAACSILMIRSWRSWLTHDETE